MKPNSLVRCRVEELLLPTYLPQAPDKNPMFLEKRVYQGSSGKVYPLPFTDRIAEQPVDWKWKAVWIENAFLRLLVLPEIGGRIHAIQDKTNGYDLIYNQPVIKPALVGLAGPWASGGIEFNWPQHHRPATFLPVDFTIEEHADGSKTIWCSDHDPMCRMKGMHGVCLHPNRAVVELKVRAYNRTPLTQTFLWWANVATRVHEAYQSFFPPDVYYVADHARRSMSEYPLAKGIYYGVNYGERGRKGIPANEVPTQFVPSHCENSKFKIAKSKLPAYAPNDLSFYANIPVPTSYMCMGSEEDFFGGYDFKALAGIVHLANHHIAPGKKQWTWGNHEFGYAWDRNLTDADGRGEYGPYIEIMSGVFTDNQPDFSFLQPGETKAWSQYWYPIQQIGPAQHANVDAAISLRVLDCGWNRSATPLSPALGGLEFTQLSARTKAGSPQRSAAAVQDITLGIAVTRKFPRAKILLAANVKKLFTATRDLAPGEPVVAKIKLPRGVKETDLRLLVTDSSGKEIISYQPKPRVQGKVPPPATEPGAPERISSADELFITGLHLDQYRHATRCPTLYWCEALRRDPLDSRCNNAMGLWHFKRGEFAAAEKHFRHAIERITQRNANPYDGEAFYNLGLTLRHLNRDDEAYNAFYKSVWNQAWQAAGYHALAEIDCCRKHWPTALEHLNQSLRLNTDNLRARNLKVMVLRRLDFQVESELFLKETRLLDPLDWWSRLLNQEAIACDLQTGLDLAHDLARTGFEALAIAAMVTLRKSDSDLPTQSLGVLPLLEYTLGWLWLRLGNKKSAGKHLRVAGKIRSDYCFPSRLEEIAILESAIRANPRDVKALYYLGNLFYDRRRHEEAIQLWEKSALLDGKFSIVWRNLGIGYFNIRKNAGRARTAYDQAYRVNPLDARLLYERDQLWKRLGESPAKRLHELEKHPDLVAQRDDLTVEFCALLNQARRHLEAMQLLTHRKFQPWEGGEGGPLGQHVRTQVALGREALRHQDFPCAISHFENALTAPPKLGEARHPLANQSDIHYWLGCALELSSELAQAKFHWRIAASAKGDFQEMSVRTFSEMTFYSALALEKLGQRAKSKQLLRDLSAYAGKLQKAEAKIDYFATSLPTMLLFEDDLQFRQATTARFLQAQAQLGLGKKAVAKKLLSDVLKRDPNHALAADLLSEHFQSKGQS